MAHIHELLGLGVPPLLARVLGSNRQATVAAQGASQADATPLIVNFALLTTSGPGQGVRLGLATGAWLTTLYNVGPDPVQLYPAEDEVINDEAPNQPMSLPAGQSLLAVPSVDRWLTAGSGLSGIAGGLAGQVQWNDQGDLAGLTVSGDAALATPSGVLTLATVNLNVGTFQGLTVNAKGLVTAAANMGYLTGNQAITLSGDVTGSGATAIAATVAGLQGHPVATTAPTTSQVLQWSGTTWAPATTVTSVATGAGLTGGPITATGTIAMANMAANSLKGNNTAAPGAPVDLTTTQVATMLGGPFLPLAGGTVTGNLNVNGFFGALNGVIDMAAAVRLAATSSVFNIATVGGGNVSSIGLFANQVEAMGNLYVDGGRIISRGSGINPSYCCYDTAANYAAGMFVGGTNLYFAQMDGAGNFFATYAYFDSGGALYLSNPMVTSNQLLPGSDNSAGVGATGRAFNQMNSYNWFTASDRDVKTALADLPTCLDLVRVIAPKSYRLRADEASRTYWGFIAQEVGAAMSAAGYEFGGHIRGEVEALSYNDLLAVLWKAVQELAAR